jgi:hypothetical protein
LTFKEGNAAESKREMKNVLDWLDVYLKNPKNDPDVIIAGDFNLASDEGKPLRVFSKVSGSFPADFI